MRGSAHASGGSLRDRVGGSRRYRCPARLAGSGSRRPQRHRQPSEGTHRRRGPAGARRRIDQRIDRRRWFARLGDDVADGNRRFPGRVELNEQQHGIPASPDRDHGNDAADSFGADVPDDGGWHGPHLQPRRRVDRRAVRSIGCGHGGVGQPEPGIPGGYRRPRRRRRAGSFRWRLRPLGGRGLVGRWPPGPCGRTRQRRGRLRPGLTGLPAFRDPRGSGWCALPDGGDHRDPTKEPSP